MRSKKFVIIYAVAVFLIVFLIAFNSVCSITQFEVVYGVGSPKMIETSKKVQDRLEEEYLKKNFLFFDESAVGKVVAEEGGGYLEVVSVEKAFPNKVRVRVREKYESYAFVMKGADGKLQYVVVGDDGTVLAIENENRNNIQNDKNNIEITGIEFKTPNVGKKFEPQEGYDAAYKALQIFIGKMNERGMGGNFVRIEYGQDEDYGGNWYDSAWFKIETAEGVLLQIVDPDKRTEEKAELALGEYVSLTDEERLHGFIHVTDVYEGGTYKDTTVRYSPNEAPVLGKTQE